MSCPDKDLHVILNDFSDLIEIVRCAYTAGGGLDFVVFSMFFWGFLGFGLTIRTQHPGPVLVAGILSASTAVAALPGMMAKIFALVLFFGLSGLGLFLYQRAQRAL